LWQAEKLQGEGEIGRNRGLENEALAGAGMGEGKSSGVEHLAWRGAACGLAQEGVVPAAINEVARHRAAEVLKMDSDLVGAAGVQVHLDASGTAKEFEDAESGAGGAAGAGGHAFAVHAMARDGDVNFATGTGPLAADDGFVGFFDLAGGELGGEAEVGGVVFGDDQAAAGILVEAMDDAGSGDAADAAEMTGAMMEEGVDESVGGVAGGRVNDQSGGLVEDEEVVILVENLQRDVLGEGFGRLDRGP
jgi:hypothetical protein